MSGGPHSTGHRPGSGARIAQRNGFRGRLRARARAVICAVLALVLTFGFSTPAQADLEVFGVEEAPQIGSVDTTITLDCYNGDMRSTAVPFEVPFSDTLFRHKEGLYSQKLAQASIALAMASFRNNKLPAEERDDRIVSFLEQAGFKSIVTYGYDEDTSIKTVGCAFGIKDIGDSTLVAMVVCGQGYKNEWLSNFTMGDSERHEGFNYAAGLVENRMASYLIDQGLSGREDLKLWCSGFSRAAAVTNLCAADFYDARTFKAGIYAYTFATPRNTRSENWADYPIFNIVGQFDPVTAVALQKWGYERYGTTLLTPAQETDSTYAQKRAAMSAVYEQVAGHAYTNLPEINQTMRSMLDLFGAVVSTPAMYCEYLQPVTYEVWDSEDILGSLDRVADTLESVGFADAETVSQLNALTETLSIAAELAATGQISGWNEKAGFKGNFFLEHSPDVYLAWMYSTDDPNELYGETCGYLHLIFTGDVDVTVYDERGRFVETVHSGGKVSFVKPEDPEIIEMFGEDAVDEAERPAISTYARGTQLVVSLPKDRNYLVVAQGSSGVEEFSYVVMDYGANALRATSSEICYVKEGEGGRAMVWSPKAGDDDGAHVSSAYTSEVFAEGEAYSPAVIARLENVNVFHLSLGHITALGALGAVAIVALILMGLGRFAMGILRKRRRARRVEQAA